MRLRRLFSTTFDRYPFGFDKKNPVVLNLKSLVEKPLYQSAEEKYKNTIAALALIAKEDRKGKLIKLGYAVSLEDGDQFTREEKEQFYEILSEKVLDQIADPKFVEPLPDIWINYVFKSFAKLNWWKHRKEIEVLFNDLRRRITKHEENGESCFELAYSTLLSCASLKQADPLLLECCAIQVKNRLRDASDPLTQNFVTLSFCAFAQFLHKDPELYDEYLKAIIKYHKFYMRPLVLTRILWSLMSLRIELPAQLRDLMLEHLVSTGFEGFDSRSFSIASWSLSTHNLGSARDRFIARFNAGVTTYLDESSSGIDLAFVAYFMSRQKIFDEIAVGYLLDLAASNVENLSAKDLKTLNVLMDKCGIENETLRSAV
jgi:hypothetical protein